MKIEESHSIRIILSLKINSLIYNNTSFFRVRIKIVLDSFLNNLLV